MHDMMDTEHGNSFTACDGIHVSVVGCTRAAQVQGHQSFGRMRTDRLRRAGTFSKINYDTVHGGRCRRMH